MQGEKLSKSEAARRAGVTLRVLQGWIDAGSLPEYTYQGGGRSFVYWHEVEAAARIVPAQRSDQDDDQPKGI